MFSTMTGLTNSDPPRRYKHMEVNLKKFQIEKVTKNIFISSIKIVKVSIISHQKKYFFGYFVCVLTLGKGYYNPAK